MLFVDEIHRLNRAVEEILYPALEDFRLDIVVGQGPAARTLTLDLPPFTLIGATTRTGPADDAAARPVRPHVPARPLHARRARRDRAPQRAHPRRRDRRATRPTRSPAARAARRGSRTASSAASATSPRCATRARSRPTIAEEALDLLEVDEVGLERFDRDLLRAIVEKFGGGPVGLSTLAVALGEEAETIEDVYEPYLLQLGFLQRTPRGRIVTELGRAHVGALRETLDALLTAALTVAASRRRRRLRGCLRRVRAQRRNPSAPPICSCFAGCRPGGSSISAAAGVARAGPGSSRSRSTTRRRSPRRCARQRPVRIDHDGRELVFGPVLRARRGDRAGRARRASSSSARPTASVDADDELLAAAAHAAVAAVEPPGRAKELADELELLEAVRAVALGVPPAPVEDAMHELAEHRRRGALVRARHRLPRRRRPAQRRRARLVARAARASELAAALAERLERRRVPVLRPGRDGARRCPARSPPSAGSARTTCSS